MRSALVHVTDRPQVQGEERLRPAIRRHRDSDQMHGVVGKEAHRVKVASLVVGSMAVKVALVARAAVEDPALAGVQAPGLHGLAASREVDDARALPLQLLEQIAQLSRGRHRSPNSEVAGLNAAQANQNAST